jgi:hypothetical protein
VDFTTPRAGAFAPAGKYEQASSGPKGPRQRDVDVGVTKCTMLKRRGSDGGALSTPEATMGDAAS